MTSRLLKFSEGKGQMGGSRRCETLGEAAGLKRWTAMAVLCSSLAFGCAPIQKPEAKTSIQETRPVKEVPEAVAEKTPEVNPKVEALVNVLGDENAEVRVNAVQDLGDAAKNEADMGAVVGALAKALGDENAEVRGNAARHLGSAAESGADISAGVGALGDLLGDPGFYGSPHAYFCNSISGDAADALGSAVVNEKSRDAALKVLKMALQNGNNHVRAGAAYALKGAAKKGADIICIVGALLEDRDVLVRAHATAALGYAAEKGADISAFVGVLGKLLGDKDYKVRQDAARDLGYAAEKGADISAFVGTLGKLLGDQVPWDMFWSTDVTALAQATTNEKSRDAALKVLGAALKDKRPYVRTGAAYALGYAAEKGADISPFVGALRAGLINEDVRISAAGALAYAATNEKSRAAALKILGAALESKNVNVRSDVATALGNVAENGTDISPFVGAVGKLLEDDRVRWIAASVLGSAAGSGADIRPFVGALVKALGDNGGFVQGAAAYALGNAAVNEKSRDDVLKALGAALEDPDANVRSGAVRALRNAGEKGVDISAFAEKMRQ